MAILHPYGKTPLLQLSPSTIGTEAAVVLAKDESRNPTGSVKARAAVAMIREALLQGKIDSSSIIIEPTSGNTGIGLAFVCAQLRLQLILTMPKSMSVERRKLLAHLGAKLVLTPTQQGMTGAIENARKLLAQNENSYMPDQFSNPANSAEHKATTAQEIWTDSSGKVDIFVAGVGTGGTLTGAGQGLRERNPNISVVAVEPAESPVISGGKPGPHPIQGIGAGFVPALLDISMVDETLPIKGEDAIAMARTLAREEGILCGISSGAAVSAASILARRPENRGKTIVTLLPDTGERYLSTKLFL